jgi:hypothetical protein
VKIAIVGHGRSPIGRGWGAKIDACDTVVRFWDCDWQGPDDYGTRFDVGVYTALPNEMAQRRRHGKMDAPVWWAYDPRGTKPAVGTPIAPAPWIARMSFDELRRRAGRRLELSRGTAAACAALDWYWPEEIILIGFDAVRDGTLAVDHYPDSFKNYLRDEGRATNLHRNGPCTASHVWAAERKLIEDLAFERDSKIVWGLDG